MAVEAKAAPVKRASLGPRRGVSLGLVGLLFMFLTPVGLIVAWWHPAFRQRNRRDPLLVAAVWVYLAMLAGFVALAFVEESSGKVAPGERVSPARKNDRR